MSDSDIQGLTTAFENLQTLETYSKMALTGEQLRAIVEAAVSSALAAQEKSFNEKLQEIKQGFQKVSVGTPSIEVYKDAEIRASVVCVETLDVMKTLPEFEGKNETYVSWRKAAHAAYKVFENFDGSSKHYQALVILKNKIKGPADTVLSSFDTPLNFKAIINRLDFTYADKRPIYLIEQEMSTLRQGNLTLIQYYEEVEKKLNLLINKTIMTYESKIASQINDKYRSDALRVFISGTRKTLSDVLFASRPADLPSALALAQEVDANHDRYLFAANFARSIEERTQKTETRQSRERNPTQDSRNNQQGKNPQFTRKTETIPKNDQVQPMDIDSSSRYRQTTFYQTQNPTQQQAIQVDNPNNQNQTTKRPNNSSARFTGPKQQRINHMTSENPSPDQYDQDYQTEAESEVNDVDDELTNYDQVNFLDTTPCSRS